MDSGAMRSGQATGCGPRVPCLVAAAALVALLGFLAVNVGGKEYAEAERRIVSNAVAEQARVVAAGVEAYRRDTGTYPAGLDNLRASRGPTGYRGPYLDEIPRNPASPDGAWAYDPREGTVSDPTGRWPGVARPKDASSSESYLDDLALPELAGSDVVTGAPLTLAPASGQTLLLYVWTGGEPSLSSDLQVLAQSGDGAVSVAGLLLRGQGVVPRDPQLVAAAAGFAMMDLRLRDAEMRRALEVTETPIVLLCDDTGRIKARIPGPVDPDRLSRAADEVWTYRELATLGG